MLIQTEPVCKCGKPSVSTKIINGTIVEPHSIPFQVNFLQRRYDNETGFCGGSLISPSYVLTGIY